MERRRRSTVDRNIQEFDSGMFAKDTLIMCRQADGLYYEAVITKVTKADGMRHFTVRHSEWELPYDETIPEDDAQYRLEEHTAQNAEYYKKIREEILAMSNRKSIADTPSGTTLPDSSTAAKKPKTEQEEATTELPQPETVIKPIDVSKLVKGTMVMCRYEDRIFYKALITDVNEVDGVRHFSIHYPKWEKCFDVTITETEARYRLAEHNDTIVAHFKKIRKAMMAVSSRKSTASTPSGTAVPERKYAITPADKKTAPAASTLSTTATDSLDARQPQCETAHDKSQANEAPVFPLPLLDLIDKDEELITRRNKLARVPARHTVKMIIDEYVASIGEADQQMDVARDQYGHAMIFPDATTEDQKEYAQSLLEYFDASIGSHSLYPFEASQFVTLYEQEVENLPPESRNNADSNLPTIVRLSGQYGVIHLLRMLAHFGKILAFTPWVDKEGLMKQAQDLLLFLLTRLPEYYNEELDYVSATEEYEESVPDGLDKKRRIIGVKQ